MTDLLVIRDALVAGARANILVDEAGRIAAIGAAIEGPAETAELDATGLVALPGGVDGLLHLVDGGDDVGSGTVAAAHGGTTSVVTLVPCDGPGQVAAAFSDFATKAQATALVDWAALVAPRQGGIGLARQLTLLRAEPGFAGLAIDLAAADETALPGMLRAARESDVRVVIRTAGTRGADAERQRLAAILGAAALADHPVHLGPITVGIDTVPGLTTGAAGLAHLCLPALPEGASVVPPLPAEAALEELWAAVVDGRVGEVVSDHRPPPLRGGEGHVGLATAEHRLTALHDAGRLSLERLAEVTATEPARRLGLAPRKGSLTVGADADIVLFDPDERWTPARGDFLGRGGAPAFQDREVTGRVRHVLVRGGVVVRDAAVIFRPGSGRPLYRLP